MKTTVKVPKFLVMFGATLALSTALLAAPMPQQDAQQPTPAPDNSATNKNDRAQGAPTADQQKMNPSDRAITQKIRSAIHKDSSLSTYAHNVKIITQDGMVTLKGPVRSDDEKSNVEAKAAAVVGQDKVTSQITIAPPK